MGTLTRARRLIQSVGAICYSVAHLRDGRRAIRTNVFFTEERQMERENNSSAPTPCKGSTTQSNNHCFFCLRKPLFLFFVFVFVLFCFFLRNCPSKSASSFVSQRYSLVVQLVFTNSGSSLCPRERRLLDGASARQGPCRKTGRRHNGTCSWPHPSCLSSPVESEAERV